MEEPSTPLRDFNPMTQAVRTPKALGEGTYGVVYKYTLGQEQFAVKQTKDSDPLTSTSMREAACMMRLNHPNVVKLISAGVYDGTFYMTLPLATTTLDKWLDALRKIGAASTEKINKNLAYQLLVGVDYCLSRNVVHRDLKPQNILLTMEESEFSLQITDFGMARALGCVLGTGFTKEVITLWYRAPEVLLEGPYGDDVDKWAVGCIMYEIFTGKVPLFSRVADEIDMLLNISKLLGKPPREIYGTYPKWSMTVGIPARGPPDFAFVDTDPTADAMVKSLIRYTNRASLRSLYENPFFDTVRDTRSQDYLFHGEQPSCMDNLFLRELRAPSISRIIPSSASFLIKAWMIAVVRNRVIEVKSSCHGITIFHLYISKNPKQYTSKEIQFILCACLWLSVTYCEIYPINRDDFVIVSDNAFTADQLEQKCDEIATALSFDFLFATAADFYLENSRFYPLTELHPGLGLSVLDAIVINDSIFTEVAPDIIGMTVIYAKCVASRIKFTNVSLIPSILPVFNKLLTCISDEAKRSTYDRIFEKIDGGVAKVIELLQQPALV